MRTKREPSATYVFCVVQSERAPVLRGVPDSVPGAGAPRVLPVDRGLWAAVADAPLDRFSSERLQEDLQDLEAVSRHALAHASVVEFFFRKAPVIPLQLFTLFSEDERAREQLASRGPALRKLFAQLRGLEEWGVRIIADPSAVDAASGRTTRERESSGPSGRDYLRNKKRLLDQSAEPPKAAMKEVDAALKSLGRVAARVRTQPFPPPGRNRPFVTGASFLVKAKKRAQWKKHVTSLTTDLAAHGHRLEMSGPWPPYHFASPGK
jgi:Gas vesicle synthesis protein GvpL/GvpF